MSPTTRARKCLAISTWGQDNTVKPQALLINAIRTSTIKTMLSFTSERLKSPKSLQRSQTVFSPTSRMTNRPTNFTPSAPARFTPVSTTHSHQEAVKGLKTTSTSSIFFSSKQSYGHQNFQVQREVLVLFKEISKSLNMRSCKQ